MTSPAALLDFFVREAGEYLDRLERLVSTAPPPAHGIASPAREASPDLQAFTAHARALRGSAAMTRLPGLAELTGTVERVGLALRDGPLEWDARLREAVTSSLDELRTLIVRVHEWSVPDQQRAMARAASLGSIAALSAPASPRNAPSSAGQAQDRVVPIARLFPDEAGQHVISRSPNPPTTATRRFRADLADVAAELAEALRAASAPMAALSGVPAPLAHALGVLRDTGDSYGAASVVTLANALETALERGVQVARPAVEATATILANRELADEVLASRVRELAARLSALTPPASATITPPRSHAAQTPSSSTTPSASMPALSSRRPAPPATGRALHALLQDGIAGINQLDAEPLSAPAALTDADVVPVESLVYRGRAALDRARQLRDAMRDAARGGRAPESGALDELYALLDLAALPD
jgi:chemotaxis protein histidine kinase CheA